MTAHGGVDFAAPLPLGYLGAIERARQLREVDPGLFTWATIAAVIKAYHGFDRHGAWYAEQLRGRVDRRPRGVPINERAAA